MKVNRKADILTAAGILFSEQGYHGTTIREIAAASEVRLGSLYAYINSKEALLWEVISYAADVFLAQVEMIPWDAPVEWQLMALVHAHLWVIAQEQPVATVFLHEWRYLNPTLRQQILLKRKTYEVSFQHMIEEGVQQGLFHVENTRTATLFVLSALNWAYQLLQYEHNLTIEQLATHYTHFILCMLKG